MYNNLNFTHQSMRCGSKFFLHLVDHCRSLLLPIALLLQTIILVGGILDRISTRTLLHFTKSRMH